MFGYYQNNGGKELCVGIEGVYNEIFVGEFGEEVEQKIFLGWKKIGQMICELIEGVDLIIMFDFLIQEVVYLELYKQLKNQGVKSGCVVVMDVKIGVVCVMVNLQCGDDGEYYEKYNQVIGMCEVLGFIFKLVMLMVVLEDEKIKLMDMVNVVGEYQFYGVKMKDFYEWGYG